MDICSPTSLVETYREAPCRHDQGGKIVAGGAIFRRSPVGPTIALGGVNMKKLSNINLLVVLSMAFASATLGAGCAPGGGGGADETPDDASKYPPIDPSARTIPAGPILATTNNIARGQRLAYHRKVIELHNFNYTI